MAANVGGVRTFCNDDSLCGHSLITPLTSFNGRILSTCDQLPDDCPVWEVAKRIMTIMIAPLAYLVLALIALVGVAIKSMSYCFKPEQGPVPPGLPIPQPGPAAIPSQASQPPQQPPASITDQAPTSTSQPSSSIATNATPSAAAPEVKVETPQIRLDPIVPTGQAPSAATLAQVQPGQIELREGLNQYNYPVRNNGHATGCSFHACEAVIWIAQNFSEAVQHYIARDQNYFNEMQKTIIGNGLIARAGALLNGMENNAFDPHELHAHTNRYVDLIRADAQSEVVTGEIYGTGVNFLDEDLRRIFTPPTGTAHPYSVVIADGQTFAFFGIDGEKAFLFDSHKSAFQVVDLQGAKHYIEHTIYHGNEMQSVTFYHGQL